MKADTVQSTTQIKLLKSCINNLIGIQALPAVWNGGHPAQIVNTLLDVLLEMLKLDFAYAQLTDSIGGAAYETVRLASDRSVIIQPQEIGRELNPWLGNIPRTLPLIVRNPIGQGEVSIVPLRLGQRDEMGALVVGSVRLDFPTPTDRLVLNLAVNQAVMTLSEVRRLSEKEQLAHELDQRIAQRTRELVAVNGELRNEIDVRKRAQQELWRKEAYMAEAQRLSQTGSFGWDVSSGEIYWSRETFRIFEYEPAAKVTIQQVVERTHPEDRAAVQQLIDRVSRGREEFDFEYRLLMPDGSVKHLRIVGHPSKNGSVSSELVGAVTDITERKRAEKELQQLVDSVPQYIVVLKPDGNVIHANRVAREYTGLNIDAFRSVEVVDSLFHPDDAKKMRIARERGLAGHDPFEIETRLRGKDGVYRWFLCRYNPLVERGSVTRWYATATEIESRKQEEERVRKENLRLEERTRIAQELHDTLLQSFLSASMQLSVTLDGVTRDSLVKARLNRILQLMNQGIEEGRNALRGLRSSNPQTLDLVAALSHIEQELSVPPEVDFRVIVNGQQQLLRPLIQHEVYRIGREALLNAFRHSRAKCVELELEYADSELRMRVRDDGCGIDAQMLRSGREGHWGLGGMRERAARIGGLLEICSSATTGTEVQLSIPSVIVFQL